MRLAILISAMVLGLAACAETSPVELTTIPPPAAEVMQDEMDAHEDGVADHGGDEPQHADDEATHDQVDENHDDDATVDSVIDVDGVRVFTGVRRGPRRSDRDVQGIERRGYRA